MSSKNLQESPSQWSFPCVRFSCVCHAASWSSPRCFPQLLGFGQHLGFLESLFGKSGCVPLYTAIQIKLFRETMILLDSHSCKDSIFHITLATKLEGLGKGPILDPLMSNMDTKWTTGRSKWNHGNWCPNHPQTPRRLGICDVQVQVGSMSLDAPQTLNFVGHLYGSLKQRHFHTMPLELEIIHQHHPPKHHPQCHDTHGMAATLLCQ